MGKQGRFLESSPEPTTLYARLKEKAIDIIQRSKWEVAFKMTVAAFCGLFANHLFFLHVLPQAMPMNGGIWSVVTAVLMIQKSIGKTYRMAARRFIGVGIGSLIGIFLVSLGQVNYFTF